MKNSSGSKAVDQYINSFDGVTNQRLRDIRSILSEDIKDIDEKVSYSIACIRIGKYYMYYAGYNNFVSIYPIHPEEYSFSEELKPFSSGKATLRFPHDKTLPKPLIRKIQASKLTTGM
jgi:uncharacterized protein YdhG (YjbR/CyaY superfamily)